MCVTTRNEFDFRMKKRGRKRILEGSNDVGRRDLVTHVSELHRLILLTNRAKRVHNRDMLFVTKFFQ